MVRAFGISDLVPKWGLLENNQAQLGKLHVTIVEMETHFVDSARSLPLLCVSYSKWNREYII